VEDHAIPATWTPQIATVIYGEPHVPYVVYLAIQHVAPYDVRALVLVAEPIRAIGHAVLYLVVYGTANDLIDGFDLQVADALWQPRGAFAGVTTALLVNQYRVKRP
jgi:hypothetical protein